MQISSNGWACNYDELITFYPRFYRTVFEMEAILRSEGHIMDQIEDGFNKAVGNMFIDEADEGTIASLEKFLRLSLKKERTLEERRRLVRSFFAGNGKISQSSIRETIKAYTGADTNCELLPCDEAGNNRLYINFERGQNETLFYSDIVQILERMIPAHIDFQAAVTRIVSVGVGKKKTAYLHGFEFAGTYPETAKLGDINAQSAAVEFSAVSAMPSYIPCGTIYSGL